MIDIDIRLERPGFTLHAAFSCGQGITALSGRSGSGKSTILNAIAGLVRPDSGIIRFGDDILFDSQRHIFQPPHKRRIALVFQDSQLFPHFSVRRNLAYGRWFRRSLAGTLDIHTVVDVLGIRHLLDRYPVSLSGGERQRVAIGRALLSAPRLLLMDEPLASLDVVRRHEIMSLIEHVRDRMGVPIIYASHALEELARLAERIVVVEDGQLAHIGATRDVLPFLARTSSLYHIENRPGSVCVLTARITGYDADYDLSLLDHPAGSITVPGLAGMHGAAVRVVIHGSDVSLALAPPDNVSIRTVLEGVVRIIHANAEPVARVDIALAGGDYLSAFVTRGAIDALGLKTGSSVFAMIKAASIARYDGRSHDN